MKIKERDERKRKDEKKRGMKRELRDEEKREGYREN
jgi:hypothetical protein